MTNTALIARESNGLATQPFILTMVCAGKETKTPIASVKAGKTMVARIERARQIKFKLSVQV